MFKTASNFLKQIQETRAHVGVRDLYNTFIHIHFLTIYIANIFFKEPLQKASILPYRNICISNNSIFADMCYELLM